MPRSAEASDDGAQQAVGLNVDQEIMDPLVGLYYPNIGLRVLYRGAVEVERFVQLVELCLGCQRSSQGGDRWLEQETELENVEYRVWVDPQRKLHRREQAVGGQRRNERPRPPLSY